MLVSSRFHKQSGVTILELMIGIVVGLIVLSGVLYVFVGAVKSSRDVLNSARLNQDMSAIMSIITSDMRRAGHWIQTASVASSPYTDLGQDINIVSSSCALYNYDTDGDGALAAAEYSGVRLSSGAVWLKTTGTSMTDCSVGTWNRISDENFMTIDTATSSITDNSVCLIDGSASTACPSSVGSSDVAGVREIQISITATVNNDTDWIKTVQESVKIRNDFLYD